MSSTTSKPKGTKPARKNTRAIFETPVKFTGELPVKKRGGRKSDLEPMLPTLQGDPGTWYKIASGKTGTVSQTRTRLLKLAKDKGLNIECETHTIADAEGMADCFARFVSPVATA